MFADTHVKESRLNIELRSIERVQGSTMNPLPNPQFAQIPFVSLCLAHRLVHRLVHRFDNLVIPILMRANLRLWGPKSTKENDDDIYPQCLAYRHSLDHMFLRCQLTLSFWDFFQTWWTSKTKENVTLTRAWFCTAFSTTENTYTPWIKHSSYSKVLHIK